MKKANAKLEVEHRLTEEYGNARIALTYGTFSFLEWRAAHKHGGTERLFLMLCYSGRLQAGDGHERDENCRHSRPNRARGALEGRRRGEPVREAARGAGEVSRLSKLVNQCPRVRLFRRGSHVSGK